MCSQLSHNTWQKNNCHTESKSEMCKLWYLCGLVSYAIISMLAKQMSAHQGTWNKPHKLDDSDQMALTWWHYRVFHGILNKTPIYDSYTGLQQGGPKTRRRGQKPEGGAFLKYSIGCMQQPVGQTWNGGAPISNGGPGTTGPPLATVLLLYLLLLRNNQVLTLWIPVKVNGLTNQNHKNVILLRVKQFLSPFAMFIDLFHPALSICLTLFLPHM